MRRSILVPLFIGLTAALSACASSGPPQESYFDRTRNLAADCEARGGILTPIGGQQTGRPETDNACKIVGGASRLPERN